MAYYSFEEFFSVKTEPRYGVVEQSTDGSPGMYIFPERFTLWQDAEDFAKEQARIFPGTHKYYVIHFDYKVVGTKQEVQVHTTLNF